MFDDYTNLDLSIEENRKKIEEFVQYLPLFKEKFIAVRTRKMKLENECGKNNDWIQIIINPRQIEELYIDLKIKNNRY